MATKGLKQSRDYLLELMNHAPPATPAAAATLTIRILQEILRLLVLLDED